MCIISYVTYSHISSSTDALVIAAELKVSEDFVRLPRVIALQNINLTKVHIFRRPVIKHHLVR
jgi:hypothetical protein